MINFPTLCLNMIVKDESHIIEKTLINLCEKFKFDYYVICDTGSSDNTIQIIETFFKQKNISGEIYNDEWKNFAHNRTLALQYAFGKTDLLLVFDADDEIVGTPIIKYSPEIHAYKMLFKTSGNMKYERICLINNKKIWKYKSVIHEYIYCIESNTKISIIEGNYWLVSGRSGSRNKDPEKYLKDALILERGYDEEKKIGGDLIGRYAFYCANSYRDYGNILKAIEWYKITLNEKQGWIQEKYVSCLELYKQLCIINEEIQGIYYLIESYKYDNERVECIYELIKYYCIKDMEHISMNFFNLINQEINIITCDKLFIDENIYKFYLPYYMIIVAQRIKNITVGLLMFEKIFQSKPMIFTEWWIKNLLYNFQFFINDIPINKQNHIINLANEYILFLFNNNVQLNNFDFLNKYKVNGINVDYIFPDNDKINDIVIAILAKDKECVLDKYLECIYNQTYYKKHIHLYIVTNDNNDNTETILTNFISKYKDEYASIYFCSKSIDEKIKQYKNHDWNELRFSVLAKIRQESIDYTIKKNAHYFIADCDNFIINTTLQDMFDVKQYGVISPMLECLSENKLYSNYHYIVDNNGYFKSHENYYKILKYELIGLIKVDVIHCTYFINNSILNNVLYSDNTKRHEYVIFSDVLRQKNINQYIDNRKKYGYLTFAETKEDLDNQSSFSKRTEKPLD